MTPELISQYLDRITTIEEDIKVEAWLYNENLPESNWWGQDSESYFNAAMDYLDKIENKSEVDLQKW